MLTMDLDNIQQNINTRVVFKEPRGMIRWIQLFFAILAFSTVVGFYTSVGINIQCRSQPPPQTPAPVMTPVSPTTNNSTTPKPNAELQPVVNSPSPASISALQQFQNASVKLEVIYPFDLSQQLVVNTCPGLSNYTYKHVGSLEASPQFFVLTGVLSLVYASASLTVYLLFSSSYDSIPVIPVADLIITAILCLFWFIGSVSLSSGVSLLKTTVVYDSISQAVCPKDFTDCSPGAEASWKSLNIGLICGYTSFFVWASGIWFVFKETHFHAPRDQFR